jgi:hypothetical protein
MNWISQHKRLAIYCRDGFSCCWCGHEVENGAQLSLDHVKPDSKGGSNHESNLVTCCVRCNSLRQNRSVASFARDVSAYTTLETTAILFHLREVVRRPLDTKMAKTIVERRGSCARAIAILAAGKKM